MMISAEVLKMSVTITHYLQPQFLRVLLYGRPNYVVQCYSCVETAHCLTFTIKLDHVEFLKLIPCYH